MSPAEQRRPDACGLAQRARDAAAARLGPRRGGDQGETLWDVARRFNTAAAPILQWNRGLRWKHPSDLGPGRRIVVPRYYASRIELWIDRERWLPLNAHIYDTDGNLFERFEHRDLKINVGLTPMDFSEDNPAYGF